MGLKGLMLGGARAGQDVKGDCEAPGGGDGIETHSVDERQLGKKGCMSKVSGLMPRHPRSDDAGTPVLKHFLPENPRQHHSGIRTTLCSSTLQ